MPVLRNLLTLCDRGSFDRRYRLGLLIKVLDPLVRRLVHNLDYYLDRPGLGLPL